MRFDHLALIALCTAGGLLACDDDADPGTPAPTADAGLIDAELDAASGRPDFNAPVEPDADLSAPDATPDAEPHPDAEPSPADAGLPDAEPEPDMAVSDVPRPGFGEITGSCGVLTVDDLTSPEPLVVINTIDFGDDAYDEGDLDQLTEGGRRIVETPNAGGSSELSEAFAFEVLARCELATLLKTENEVLYVPEPGSITDFLAEIDEEKIGVSVARAIIFPFDAPYPVEEAERVLQGKLEGILESSERVLPEDAWRKQILHVIAYGPMHVESLVTAYEGFDDALKADTIVWITVTDGEDAPLY